MEEINDKKMQEIWLERLCASRVDSPYWNFNPFEDTPPAPGEPRYSAIAGVQMDSVQRDSGYRVHTACRAIEYARNLCRDVPPEYREGYWFGIPVVVNINDPLDSPEAAAARAIKTGEVVVVTKEDAARIQSYRMAGIID